MSRAFTIGLLVVAGVVYSISKRAAPVSVQPVAASRNLPLVNVTYYHRWIINVNGERNQFTTELQSTNPVPYNGVTFSDEWTETIVEPAWR